MIFSGIGMKAACVRDGMFVSLVAADRVDNSLHNELAAIQPPLDTVMYASRKLFIFADFLSLFVLLLFLKFFIYLQVQRLSSNLSNSKVVAIRLYVNCVNWFQIIQCEARHVPILFSS